METSVTDPFSNLASEVLGDVFIHCLPAETEPISPNSAPLLLVRVCRRWRQVALGTPDLWQKIHLGRRLGQDPLFVLDLFLAQSGALPLTITLPLPKSTSIELTEKVINRIFDNFHRVLALEGHTSRLFPCFIYNRLHSPSANPHRQSPCHIYAPLLTRFDVTGFDIPRELPDEEYIRNCIFAPNLEELHLNTSRVALSMIRFFPETLKVLTGCYIVDVAQTTDMTFLCHASNLDTLGLVIYDLFEDITLKIPTQILLPKLKQLDILLFGDRFIEILDSFLFPNIEELNIHVRGIPSFSKAVQFITKGQTPPLRSLRLAGSGRSEDDGFLDARLEPFLRFKQVEELKLIGFVIDGGEQSLHLFFGKENGEYQLFPRLSIILLRKMTFRGSSCEMLMDILRSRSISNDVYAKFYNCTFQPDDKEALETLRGETGTRLTISIDDNDVGK